MTNVVTVTEPSELTIVEGSVTTTVAVTSPVGATITAASSGPQGPTGASPVYSRAGQLSPLVGQGRIYFESNAVISRIRVAAGTSPIGSPVILDINVNGVSIFTDQAQRLSIAAGANTATSTPNRMVSAGDYLTVDIDSVGSTNPGADLTVTVSVQ